MQSTAFFFVIAFLAAVSAHTYLTKPFPLVRNTGGCRIGDGVNCVGPCTYNPSNRNFYKHNSEVRETYRRGERVTFGWARNNHNAGYMAFSIVPWTVNCQNVIPSDRSGNNFMSPAMGIKTFQDFVVLYTCFVEDFQPCTRGSRVCGTDMTNRYFTKQVTIPTSIPDGEYILGSVWYGDQTQTDYYSCASIRIQGGPLTATDKMEASSCRTFNHKPGECPRTTPGTRCPNKLPYRQPFNGFPTGNGWTQNSVVRQSTYTNARCGANPMNNPPPPMNTQAPPPPMNTPMNTPPPPMNTQAPPPPMNNGPRCLLKPRVQYGKSWKGNDGNTVRNMNIRGFTDSLANGAVLDIKYSRNLKEVWGSPWGAADKAEVRSNGILRVTTRGHNAIGVNLWSRSSNSFQVQSIKLVSGRNRDGQNCRAQTVTV